MLTAGKGWSSGLGLGEIETLFPTIHNCLRLGLTLWYDVSNGKEREVRRVEREEAGPGSFNGDSGHGISEVYNGS